MKRELEKLDGTQEEPDEGVTGINHATVKGTSPPEAVASPGAYINYASLSLKQ
jgi:hypothetical protein